MTAEKQEGDRERERERERELMLHNSSNQFHFPRPDSLAVVVTQF
jgi:hypothetical protein